MDYVPFLKKKEPKKLSTEYVFYKTVLAVFAVSTVFICCMRDLGKKC